MLKNGTSASPAIAFASSVLPQPGGPMSITPFGILPPSFWNRFGSFRKSMISWTSSFASSMPATSLNVTFSSPLARSRARLLPNERALCPTPRIWREMRNQMIPAMRTIGRKVKMTWVKNAFDGSTLISTSCSFKSPVRALRAASPGTVSTVNLPPSR